MPWPSWLSLGVGRQVDNRPTRGQGEDTTPAILNTSLQKPLDAQGWSPYTSLVSGALASVATLALLRAYKTYIRRIPTVEYLKPTLLGRRSLYGFVTSVGDGDGFRLFHTPGGRALGWGWLPWRRMDKLSGRALRDQTLSVRIAGVDAPEMSHFGKDAQPHSQEALDWLKGFVLRRYVRAVPYRRDQYDRVVCTVFRRRWIFFRTDVGYEMLKRGLATVYEAKYGSEFGNKEKEYREAEAYAKARNLGMWQKPGLIAQMLGRAGRVESPREYKDRYAASKDPATAPKKDLATTSKKAK